MRGKHELPGRERFLEALQGGRPDRVPVFLRDLTLGLDIAGYSTPEVCGGDYDAVKAAKAVLASRSRFGQDAMVGCIHSVGLEAQALGGEVSYPDRGIPAVTRHPLASLNDIRSLELPDLEREPAYRGVLDCYEIVSSQLKGGTAVVCNLEGPMTKAALLRGMEHFAMDLVQDPGTARDLVRLSVSLSQQFLEETSRRGAEVLFVAAATDNPELFGTEAFRQHTLPGIGQLVRSAKTEGMLSVFHPHGIFSGAASPLVDESIATGIQGFQFAEGNDFALLKPKHQGRVCILGGVDAFTTLLFGPEQRIDAETDWFMRTCAPGGGYVFMCSCSLHRGMPLGNLDSLMISCRDHGGYDNEVL